MAEECNDPNNIPKVLLNILSQMDKEDAKTFSTLCRMSVLVDSEYAPVIISSKFDEYCKFEITFDKLVSLSALGLIEMDLSGLSFGYSLTSKESLVKIHYYDNEYNVFRDEKKIDIGNVIFTKAGLALCKSIDVEKINGFWEEYCLPFWKEQVNKE